MNVQKDSIEVCGKALEALTVELFGARLMIIQAPKGLLACGYIDFRAAEKLGHACAIVRGVKNYSDMLSAKVADLSAAAQTLGISEGLSGQEALEKML